MLTDSEILKLNKLLNEQKIDLLKEGLVCFDKDTNPNYKFLYNALKEQEYDSKDKLTIFS